MAIGVGHQIILRDGRKGQVVATYGNFDCREYKIKVGKNILHYTQDELFGELASSSQSRGIYTFDMTYSGSSPR
jgi:hypothetical protein